MIGSDNALNKTGTQRPEDGSTTTGHTRVFTASARASTSTGAVAEFRYGLAMQLTRIKVLPEMLGVDRIWSFDLVGYDYCLLCSSPWQTTLIVIKGDFVNEFVVATDSTITADMMASGLDPKTVQIMHVSPNSVQIIRISEDGDGDATIEIVASLSLGKVLVAECVFDTGLLLLGVEMNGEYHLCFYKASTGIECHLRRLAYTIALDSEPTCATIVPFRAIHPMDTIAEIYVAVGCVDGRLDLHHVDFSDGSTDDHKERKSCYMHGVPCESLTFAPVFDRDDSGTQSGILVCGFRDGNVLVMRINFHTPLTEDISAILLSRNFGLLPAHVAAHHSVTGKTTVIVQSGAHLCHFDFGGGVRGPSLTTIHLSLENETFLDSSIGNFHLPRSYGLQPHQHVCLINGRIFVASLSDEPGVVTNARAIPAVPKRLLFSNFLQRLIVSATITGNDPETHKRFALSVIYILTVDSPAPTHGTEAAAYVGQPGEKINDLVEWFPKRGSRTYHFLIATMQVVDTDSSTSGQLRIFKISKHSGTGHTLKVTHDSREDEPVYAIAQYGDESLVYGSGNKLKLRKFRVDEGR